MKKRNYDIVLYLPVDLQEKMSSPVEYFDRSFTEIGKPVFHYKIGYIHFNSITTGVFVSVYGLDRSFSTDELNKVMANDLRSIKIQKEIRSFCESGKQLEGYTLSTVGSARDKFLANSDTLRFSLLPLFDKALEKNLEVLKLAKEEMVSFEFSLGNEEAKKKLISTLINESNEKSDEWKAIFGPEIFEMKTGKTFDNTLGLVKAPFEVSFKDLKHSEDSGKAFDEIVEKGAAINKTFNFVELEGENGKKVTLEAYHGIDYRNWDGSRKDISLTDELVLRGTLPEKDLEKVFDIMENNWFFSQYPPQSFDNEISKDSMKLYNEYKEKNMNNDIPFDVNEKKEPLMSLSDGEANYAWNHLADKSVTGKDIAVLLGDTPWRSKEELMAEKRKFITFRPEAGSKEASRMSRGLELQKETANRFADKIGNDLEEGAIYRSEEKPIMVARVTHQTKEGYPVLVLSTGVNNAFLWENNSVPQNVVDECQWNMALTGAKKAYVACMVDNLGEDGQPIKGLDQEFHMAEIKRDEVQINKMIQEVDNFEKEWKREYLVAKLPKEAFEKKDKIYEVTMPEGSSLDGVKVVLPERIVKTHGKGKMYQIILPIKNERGQSYLYQKVGGKSVSSAEIYCAANKVRGRALFINNRSAFGKGKIKRNRSAEIPEEIFLGK